MSRKPRILCLGYDPALNRTRRLLLQRSFDVRQAASLAEAQQILRDQPVHVVLICSSVPTHDARAIVRLVRTDCPDAKILALEQGSPRLFLAPPDLEVRPDGPADLLRQLAAMTGLA